MRNKGYNKSIYDCIRDVEELIWDLENNYHLPVRFRKLSKVEWDKERPLYIEYLEKELKRMQLIAEGKNVSLRPRRKNYKSKFQKFGPKSRTT